VANVRSGTGTACISISRERERECVCVREGTKALLMARTRHSYSYRTHQVESPRTHSAIIEFSSKSNQAKFCTPSAFLTKRQWDDDDDADDDGDDDDEVDKDAIAIAVALGWLQVQRYKFAAGHTG